MPQPERLPPPEPDIAPELSRAFAQTFITRHDLYAVQRNDGRYTCLRRPLEVESVAAHLRGEVTLGAYALDAESRARWVCFDADAESQWDQLRALVASLACQEIPSYLEQSRRGGHLWLFFEQPLPGKDARQFGHHLLQMSGVTDVELFPKQDLLTTGPGSLVRLPLGIHRKTGIRYPFIHPDGTPLASTVHEQIQRLAQPALVPLAVVHVYLTQAQPKEIEPQPPIHIPAGVGAGETLSDRLKDRISVYDYVSQYVPLDERGRGLCPFHPDRHASFSVNAFENYWHCFAGCGGGSIIDFAMKWRETHGEDGSFTATVKALAETLLPR